LLLASILCIGAFPLFLYGLEVCSPGSPKAPNSKYCKIELPAIREETLCTNRPVLKDWSEDDIIDFFGPCGYDPLGKEEIEAQRAELRRNLREAAIDEL